MNDIKGALEDLRQQANRDGLASASATELERYATALCFSQAFSFFQEREYPQLCETVRTHLLRAHIAKLQEHITGLDAKNTRLSVLVVALTVASLIGTAAQIWFAYKADKKAEAVSTSTASVPQMPNQKPPTQPHAAPQAFGQPTKKAP